MPSERASTAVATYPGGLTRRQVVVWRNCVFAVFALCGVGVSSWAARIPSVAQALSIDTQQVGILLLGASFGSILGLSASSHVVARFGAARTIAWCVSIGAVGFAVIGIGTAVGPSFITVLLGLFFWGASQGMCEVPMNVSGAANERVIGRSIMPIFHGFFSIGTIVGSGIAAIAEALKVPVVLHLSVIAVASIVTVQFVTRGIQSEHIVAHGQEEVHASDPSKTWRGRLSVWRNPATILIGLIVLGMALAEGSANDWLALAMVKGHHVDHATGALLFGVFVTAMTVGRFLGVGLIDRFGRVPILRGSALFAGVGLIVVIFVPNTWISVIGIVIWGLGSALGFPIGMSAAADDSRTAAARVGAVATVGYLAFLAGPPLIGFLGQQFGILNGLLVVLVFVAASGAVSFAAREPQALRPRG
jgi:fucose permease